MLLRKTDIKIFLIILISVFIWIPPYKLTQINANIFMIIRIIIALPSMVEIAKKPKLSKIQFSIIIYMVVVFFSTYINSGIRIALISIIDPIMYFSMFDILTKSFIKSSRATYIGLFFILGFYILNSLAEMQYFVFSFNTQEMNTKLYYIGGKFDTCYLFMIMFYLICLFINKYVHVSKKTVYFMIGIIFLLFAAQTGCGTGILGFVFIILLVLFPTSCFIKIKTAIYPLLVLIIDISSFGLRYIVNIPIINYIIVQVLGKNASLTGRLTIYSRIDQLLTKKFMLGYGYGTNSIKSIIDFANTQNGLLQKIYYFGIIGAFVFIMIIKNVGENILKSSVFVKKITFAVFVGFIICSAVEITFENLFMFFLAIAYAVSERDYVKEN